MEIKLAEEILDSNLQTIADNYDMSQDEFNIVIKAMKEYAAQFIDLAAKNAYVEFEDLTDNSIFDYTDVLYDDDVSAQVNQQSILKIKEQIK